MLVQPAFAKKVKVLTEDSVREFIEESTALTNGESKKSIKDTVRFFETHLTKDARFKSVVQYILPGFPPQETALALNKKDFLQSLRDGEKSMEDHETFVDVKKVTVLSNGKQAVVETEGKETGVMLIPVDEFKTERVPVEGHTMCNQIIRLSKKGVIQIYNAVCSTQIEFTSEF